MRQRVSQLHEIVFNPRRRNQVVCLVLGEG
jgi:hypothetical protein